MAFRTRVRRAITKALKLFRIRRPTAQKASAEARKNVKLAGDMTIKGLSQEMAEEFADDLKEILQRQLISWVPLSSGYAKRKRMLGLDPRILIATARYVRSIQATQLRDGTWIVAVPEEPLSPGSKYTLRDLARWLEYGTRTMPARPHWRPAAQLWRTKIYQVRRRARHTLTQQMKKAGFK